MIQILQITLWSVALVNARFVCVFGNPTVAEEYRLRRVFVGTVVSERYEPPTKYFDQEGTTYTVRVDEPIKGQLQRTIRIFSENSSARWPMQVGTKYLLFVYRDSGRAIVDSCGNSEVYTASSLQLREVRRLKAAEKRN
jgi:hypothetical protein